MKNLLKTMMNRNALAIPEPEVAAQEAIAAVREEMEYLQTKETRTTAVGQSEVVAVPPKEVYRNKPQAPERDAEEPALDTEAVEVEPPAPKRDTRKYPFPKSEPELFVEFTTGRIQRWGASEFFDFTGFEEWFKTARPADSIRITTTAGRVTVIVRSAIICYEITT